VATFEISVNGERRFVGDDVKAVTIVSDWISRKQLDRISVHVGVGGPGEREVHYLGSDLHAGDEISIRVLEDDELVASDAPEACSFCGQEMHHVQSLVAGKQAAICDGCVASFDAVVTTSAALPLGAAIRQDGDERCGFCLKGPSEVAGLFVRNAAAICPECLRVCADIRRDAGRPED
jgi:hypothetical protein